MEIGGEKNVHVSKRVFNKLRDNIEVSKTHFKDNLLCNCSEMLHEMLTDNILLN